MSATGYGQSLTRGNVYQKSGKNSKRIPDEVYAYIDDRHRAGLTPTEIQRMVFRTFDLSVSNGAVRGRIRKIEGRP